jgi:ABC-type multidrug transport system fused ATPase/permease subunit
MNKNNKNKYKEVVNRIFEIRSVVFLNTVASFIDIATLYVISLLIAKIGEGNEEARIVIMLLIGTAILRTFFINLIKTHVFRLVFRLKNIRESLLLDDFIKNRVGSINKDESNYIAIFREKINNSSLISTVNFDIPFSSLVAELVLSIGAISILLSTLGFEIVLLMVPIFIILSIILKSISKRLHQLGGRIILLNKERLVKVENLIEASLELGIQGDQKSFLKYFDSVNQKVNDLFSEQTKIGVFIQLIVESTAFITIGIIFWYISSGFGSFSIENIATSLVVLSRLIPTMTRSIASITQLNYGVPAVINLTK